MGTRIATGFQLEVDAMRFPGLLPLIALLAAAASAHADPPQRARRRVARDYFRHTISLGASVGVGSPLGLTGGFVELRPWRALGVSVGGGLGGNFGPSVAATVVVSPVGTRRWALALETSLSHHVAYAQGRALSDGRELPASSNWVGVGVASEWRPSRSLLLRVAVGRSWLLDTSGYGVIRQRELTEAEQAIGFLPGVTAVDAARAAMAGETLGVWYVHIDIAPTWRW
ncbi:MAG: hypothetical protein IPN17_13445 [Deltaproteobacteria bacterium]|nr:hypothetical protein [Deltaproteobacteria bacterium]